MARKVVTVSIDHRHAGDSEFNEWLGRINAKFVDTVASEVVFETDVQGLFTTFMQHLPASERQYHDCHACRDFITKYGGLVTISQNGTLQSAIWPLINIPTMYMGAVIAMIEQVQLLGNVIGPFYTKEKVLGHPKTGIWTHFAVRVPEASKASVNSLVLTPSQVAAEKREDYKNLCLALNTWKLKTIETANIYLQSGVLYRAEKVAVNAEWLLRAVKEQKDTSVIRRRIHLLWKAVATAPTGFCHPRSSMLGSLLDNIEAGMPAAVVARKFKEKMDPTQYQRPQAAPAAGNVAAAERIVEQLKAAGSLERRFATVEDVQHRALWTPRSYRQTPVTGQAGVFSHVQTKDIPAERDWDQLLMRGPITWEKFARTVLPHLERLRVMAPPAGPYAGFATARNRMAPPIIQWDLPNARNPVSWYLYSGGSVAGAWHLNANMWYDVSGVTLQPNMWNDAVDFSHQGKGVFFGITEAWDANAKSAGSALFPEILKSEFHGIRATIEAYSHGTQLQGPIMSALCGLMPQASNTGWNIQLRATMPGGSVTTEYTLDRWD